jgi:type I restriction enzyme S subunit
MTVYHSTMAKAQIDPEIKTTAGQNTINQKSMGKIMIPLPPLAEQKRIVARLEEMMSVF